MYYFFFLTVKGIHVHDRNFENYRKRTKTYKIIQNSNPTTKDYLLAFLCFFFF